jgi:thioredoxin reductase (NADPH)
VCDGAFYKGQAVAVIGGGNSALQDAVLLSEGCPKVYVVQNLAFLTGEKGLVNILEKRDNVEFIYSSVVESVAKGDEGLSSVTIKNTESGEVRVLDVQGMFVAIGQIPECEAFADRVKLNSYGYIEAGENCLPQSVGEGADGIFVAGDCRTKMIRQVTTATADGAVAALSAIRYVDSL